MYMPTYYKTFVDDYWSLVKDVTLWDVAGERQVEVQGKDAEKFIEFITPRDISKCRIGQCQCSTIAPGLDLALGGRRTFFRCKMHFSAFSFPPHWWEATNSRVACPFRKAGVHCIQWPGLYYFQQWPAAFSLLSGLSHNALPSKREPLGLPTNLIWQYLAGSLQH